MKRLIAIITALVMLFSMGTVFADYEESGTYADLAHKSGGNNEIGVFEDYKTLVDDNLQELLSMTSAERQSLVADIITRAGTVYVDSAQVDFTQNELSDYLAYGLENMSETKKYLAHYGISSLVDVPVTIDFGDNESFEITMEKSFAVAAYGRGLSRIIIKNDEVGVEFQVMKFPDLSDVPTVTVEIFKHKDIYQLGLPTKEELSKANICFYNAKDGDWIYAASGDVFTRYARKDNCPIGANRYFRISSAEDAVEFSDVSGDHWAYDYVYSLVDSGIVSGESQDRFNPEGAVTREQFVKMLVEAMAIAPEQQMVAFGDVSPADWCFPYVNAAYTAGIISGVSETEFGVGQPVSRQDIAVMVDRALKYKGMPIETTDDSYFECSDVSEISDYALPSVKAMYAVDVLSGNEENCFNPHAPATRAEAAKIIYMMLKYIERN